MDEKYKHTFIFASSEPYVSKEKAAIAGNKITGVLTLKVGLIMFR